jgi:hypothetical protein
LDSFGLGYGSVTARLETVTNFEFPIRQGISWVPEQLLASQKRLSSTGSVVYVSNIHIKGRLVSGVRDPHLFV